MTTKNKAKSSSAANGSASSASASAFGQESWQQGANFVNGIMQNSASEAEKFQKQISGMFSDNFNKVSKSSNSMSSAANQAMKISKDNMDSIVESGNVVSEIFNNANKEASKMANNLFSQNVELSKKLFTCRTLNDLLDLQNEMFKTNVENVIADSMKVSENAFKSASKASESINESLSDTFSKMMKASSFAA